MDDFSESEVSVHEVEVIEMAPDETGDDAMAN